MTQSGHSATVRTYIKLGIVVTARQELQA